MKTVDPSISVTALCDVVRSAGPRTVRPAPEVLDLLSAINEAMDVPLPAPGAGNERAYQALMERRMTYVRCALGSVLEPGLTEPGALSQEDADWLRRHTAITPVTYCAYEAQSMPVSA